MADKNRVPDYEISTYNKRSPQNSSVVDRVRNNGSKGGADEHSSSTNQQR